MPETEGRGHVQGVINTSFNSQSACRSFRSVPVTIALIVAVSCALLSMVACALAAYFFLRSSTLATKLQSSASLQSELTEIRDYMGKLDRWAKRINARDIMTERRNRPSSDVQSTQSSEGNSNLKDELRRRAGLIAGRPAQHTRNSEE